MVNCGNGMLVKKMMEPYIGVSNISAGNKHSLIDANLLISKILSMDTWLDENVLVISRDDVIDIIEEMKNQSTIV